MPSTFTKSGGAGMSFLSGLENLEFFVGHLPLPVSTSPGRLVGGRINLRLTVKVDLYYKEWF
jgi:hypothetical protein